MSIVIYSEYADKRKPHRSQESSAESFFLNENIDIQRNVMLLS